MFDNTPPLVIAPEVVHYVTLDMRVQGAIHSPCLKGIQARTDYCVCF